jgi:hypothetical protein
MRGHRPRLQEKVGGQFPVVQKPCEPGREGVVVQIPEENPWNNYPRLRLQGLLRVIFLSPQPAPPGQA